MRRMLLNRFGVRPVISAMSALTIVAILLLPGGSGASAQTCGGTTTSFVSGTTIFNDSTTAVGSDTTSAPTTVPCSPPPCQPPTSAVAGPLWQLGKTLNLAPVRDLAVSLCALGL